MGVGRAVAFRTVLECQVSGGTGHSQRRGSRRSVRGGQPSLSLVMDEAQVGRYCAAEGCPPPYPGRWRNGARSGGADQLQDRPGVIGGGGELAVLDGEVSSGDGRWTVLASSRRPKRIPVDYASRCF